MENVQYEDIFMKEHDKYECFMVVNEYEDDFMNTYK